MYRMYDWFDNLERRGREGLRMGLFLGVMAAILTTIQFGPSLMQLAAFVVLFVLGLGRVFHLGRRPKP